MWRKILQYLELRKFDSFPIQLTEPEPDLVSTQPMAALPNEGLNDVQEKLEKQHIIDLCIQEYAMLRAEQRTRLDSANKIIHYYAVVVGAVIVGLLSIYKSGGQADFLSVFHNTMLLIPLITLPFAFAQQNEEIFVRHIGDYFEEMKSQISSADDKEYWKWEEYHNRPSSFESQLTGVFRAGLLIIYSAVSLVLFIATSHPVQWFESFSLVSRSFAVAILLTFDCLLLLMAFFTAYRMARKKRHSSSTGAHIENVRSYEVRNYRK